jgi:hypothetical protein
MHPGKAISFDPETVQQLELILHKAWQSIPSERRQHTTRGHIAQRIIKLAAQGVRDPERLRAYAVLESP